MEFWVKVRKKRQKREKAHPQQPDQLGTGQSHFPASVPIKNKLFIQVLTENRGRPTTGWPRASSPPARWEGAWASRLLGAARLFQELPRAGGVWRCWEGEWGASLSQFGFIPGKCSILCRMRKPHRSDSYNRVPSRFFGSRSDFGPKKTRNPYKKCSNWVNNLHFYFLLLEIFIL